MIATRGASLQQACLSTLFFFASVFVVVTLKANQTNYVQMRTSFSKSDVHTRVNTIKLRATTNFSEDDVHIVMGSDTAYAFSTLLAMHSILNHTSSLSKSKLTFLFFFRHLISFCFKFGFIFSQQITSQQTY